jgi:two-component system, chemotaxis family, protein-glutamate methylesterase/glutaminase
MTPAAPLKPIRAVVVEDSTATRALVVRILQADGDIVVVGQAASSADAIERTVELRPDVVTLDLYLPDGGGRHVIEQIMAQAPTPILVLSHSVDDRRSASVVDALVAGALDALPKPERWTADLESQLRRNVRVLQKVHVIRHRRTSSDRLGDCRNLDAPPVGRRTVAIAASTGGPSALATVLAGLAGTAAPVLVVQHLHRDFTAGLIDWMARVSALPVELAEHGRVPRPGRVYVAPGGLHLRLGADSRLALSPDPVTVHRPSADELFRSVAEHAGRGAIGVLLTGMGDDGAKGLLAIKDHGGRTFAQDEASSAVFGMPAAARRLGAVEDMMPPEALARAITAATLEKPR